MISKDGGEDEKASRFCLASFVRRVVMRSSPDFSGIRFSWSIWFMNFWIPFMWFDWSCGWYLSSSSELRRILSESIFTVIRCRSFASGETEGEWK